MSAYFKKFEHRAVTGGAGDAGKPVKLNANGMIDVSMLDEAPAGSIPAGTTDGPSAALSHGNTGNATSSLTHSTEDNLPPYVVVNFIIKT
jgi:microcystin-dependent protein